MKYLFILQTDEATKVYEHFMDLGVKPNAMTYSLLVDAHLIKREPKAALSVVDEMVTCLSHSQHNISDKMTLLVILAKKLYFGFMCRCMPSINLPRTC